MPRLSLKGSNMRNTNDLVDQIRRLGNEGKKLRVTEEERQQIMINYQDRGYTHYRVVWPIFFNDLKGGVWEAYAEDPRLTKLKKGLYENT